MPDLDLFQRDLGLEKPWEVVDVGFDAEQKRLDLRIDFAKGVKFPCPECGREGCSVHDTEQHTWRHMNFFEHEAYLHARVPRVKCPEHGVKQVQVPWARPRSDFTLLFEALVMALVAEMPVKPVAGLVGEEDKRIWRIVHHYVDQAVEAQDLAGMEELGIDDTSFRRGQSYVSVFADIWARISGERCLWPRAAARKRSSNSPGFWPTAAGIPGRSRRSARTCRGRTWPGCAST